MLAVVFVCVLLGACSRNIHKQNRCLKSDTCLYNSGWKMGFEPTTLGTLYISFLRSLTILCLQMCLHRQRYKLKIN